MVEFNHFFVSLHTGINFKSKDMNQVINKLARSIIDIDIDNTFKHAKVINEDDDGKKYKTTVTFMENTFTSTSELIDIVTNESKNVGIVISYITRHIRYGNNHIELSSTDIAKEYGADKSNIGKGIKRLVELEVIYKLSDRIPNNILPKNTYVLNHNFFYKGNLKKLEKEINEQRQIDREEEFIKQNNN